MPESPFYDGFPYIELKMPLSDWERLPPNPAYKYEYWDGEAHLSPRLWTRTAVLPLDSLRPVPLRRPPTRTLAAPDWETLPDLFYGSFAGELPFRLLPPPEGQALSRDCLRHTQAGHDGELIPTACLVTEGGEHQPARLEGRLVGAALVTLTPVRRVWVFSECDLPPDALVPHQTWIFVERWQARRGVGASLLGAAVERLRELGYDRLTSTFLTANYGSMLWHWQMGFQLLPGTPSLDRAAVRKAERNQSTPMT